MEVINLEPLAFIEQKGKGPMTHVKQKIETGMPIGGKLMVDVMRSTRASRRLAGLRAHTTGGRSSGAGSKVTNAPIMVEKRGWQMRCIFHIGI